MSETIHLGEGLVVPVAFRRRKGMRHLRLSIGQRNELVISLPWHCAKRDAVEFARCNSGWVAEQIANTPPARSVEGWLGEYPRLSARGTHWRPDLRAAESGSARYWFEDGGTVVLRPTPATPILALVRRFAASELRLRAVEFGRRHGLLPGTVAVRDQASRWGSCSARRHVSLNWRLVLLPVRLQDSVILHELAHLRELNHSRRFWQQVEELDPDYRLHNRQLDAIAPVLLRVGRGECQASAV